MAASLMTHEPDLKLNGFCLWVHGYEFPDTSEYWDANWLRITARMSASGAVVEVEGALVRTDELERFAEGLTAVFETLAGKAELKCLEPYLELSLEMQSLGAVAVRVSITPDPLSQSHSFEFGVDQSYLPPVLDACRRILADFPVKGSPSD